MWRKWQKVTEMWRKRQKEKKELTWAELRTYPIAKRNKNLMTLFKEKDIKSAIACFAYIRAVDLAIKYNYPKKRVRLLQMLAVNKCAFVYENYKALADLINEYGLSYEDVIECIDENKKHVLPKIYDQYTSELG